MRLLESIWPVIIAILRTVWPAWELGRLARVVEAEMPEEDRYLIAFFLKGYPPERICMIRRLTIDELTSEAARVRWDFKGIIETHGFDKSTNPEVKSLIKRTYMVLSR